MQTKESDTIRRGSTFLPGRWVPETPPQLEVPPGVPGPLPTGVSRDCPQPPHSSQDAQRGLGRFLHGQAAGRHAGHESQLPVWTHSR